MSPACSAGGGLTVVVGPSPRPTGTWRRSRRKGATGGCSQIGSTSNSSRCSSMERTMVSVGGRAPPQRRAAADFTISFARRSSRFFQRFEPHPLIGGQTRPAALIRLGPTHPARNVSDVIPNFSEIEQITAHCDSSSASRLNTIGTAPSRTSPDTCLCLPSPHPFKTGASKKPGKVHIAQSW